MGQKCSSNIGVDIDVESVMEGMFSNMMMPEVMAYLSEHMKEFRDEIEREYFASIVKYKTNHITIKTTADLNLMELTHIKIKGPLVTAYCTIQNVELTYPGQL